MYIKQLCVKCCNSKIWVLDYDFEGKPLNLSRIKQRFQKCEVTSYMQCATNFGMRIFMRMVESLNTKKPSNSFEINCKPFHSRLVTKY